MMMQRAHGFSMIEVLVSIVILSVGLLGTAGLVAGSLKGGNESYNRSQATVLADDIIDRMRASITAARAGDYEILAGAAADACDASAANTMAHYDCEDWKAALEQSLPSGDGSVSLDLVTFVATVTVSWGDAEQFVTTSQLPKP